jgi:putative DNA modification/repair radical SAM protein
MEQLLLTVKILRNEYKFNGYIHIKAIPGADLRLISETGCYVDRMSVNIELPSSERLMLLAPQKNKESILKPMNFIQSGITAGKEEKKLFKKAPQFVPAGQSTQMIVGATPDHDLSILRLSEKLYQRFKLKRVYYSAYVPVSTNPNLPAISKPPLLREHRLYQADWLLRFYGFSADELLNENMPDFDTELDPKSDWALRNLDKFPVEINKADISTLLRVPGIGTTSAKRIINARRVCNLGFDDLKKLGVVLKRARFFITCKGKCSTEFMENELMIKQYLKTGNTRVKSDYGYEQISIYSYFPEISAHSIYSSVTGQL